MRPGQASLIHVLIVRQNEPFPYGWVGQEARALASQGYQVTTISPAGFGYDSQDEVLDGVRALRFRAPGDSEGLAKYLREYGVTSTRIARLIWRVRRESQVDAVIVSTPPDFLLPLVLPLKRGGTGIVYDQRDPGPELFEAKFGRQGALYRALLAAERFAWRNADVVTPHNESCADLARSRGGVTDDRIYIVGVGPDPQRIFPVEPRPELRRGKRHLVLWMGTISSQEGLDHLIEAADLLVHEDNREDVAFAIVGPGNTRDAVLQDVQRRGLQDVVELPGVITDTALLRAYMATADVCVSVDESNPMNDKSTMMKVLEYMAMGRPVVQFPLAEMRRVCGDASVYARDRDPRDLADKIRGLLDDPGRRSEIGRRARSRVLDGLMWSDQVPMLVQAVEDAVAAGRRRRG